MTKKLAVLDLFSGIGGFSLGLERTGGFETKAFCEIEPFCQRVLAKHWPGVPIYDDIRELTGARLAADGIAVDVIFGGFPCQDVSFAGKRAGLEGARSGLWSEYRRLIDELRPQFVIVENVPGLLSLGLGTVLGDLSEIGFDAVWDCVPACAVGAPHRRDRVWLVGYANDSGQSAVAQHDEASRLSGLVADAGRWRLQHRRGPGQLHGPGTPDGGQARSEFSIPGASGRSGETVADADGSHGHGRGGTLQMGWQRSAGQAAHDGDARGTQWSTEPDVGRVAHGVPSRVDRLRSLGNAVVPQIPELIGKAILEAEGGR